MVKDFKFLAAVFFSIILFASLASAAFSVGNSSNSLEKIYGPSENVRGWINISLDNANSDSLLEDSRGNSIGLLDFLKTKTGYQYSCQPTDCSEDYSAINGTTSKVLNLDSGEYELVGLQFTGNLVGINSASFTVQSDAGTSCQNQLKVDILDDGVTDFINNKVASGTGCTDSKNYGCYSDSSQNEEYIVSDLPYCQKINISESPGFTLGAWVKKVSGSRTLKAFLYDKDGFEVGSCILPDASAAGGEVSCDVSYPVIESDSYYTCISSSTGSGEYRIRGNKNPSEGCGFFGVPPPSVSPAAYQIFTQGKKFDAVGTLQVPNSFLDGNVFAAMIENYLSEKYGSFDCTSGCTVPVKITSGANQQITLNNLSVNYQKGAGVVTENTFYDLDKIPAKIDSNFQKFYLDDAGFTVPKGLGSYTFKLSLDNKEILSEEMEVKEVPQIYFLSPLTVAASYPTKFSVEVNSSNNISKIFWDFGDNKTEVTSGKEISHTYTTLGNYTLTVTVVDSKDLSSSKTFDVEVDSAKSLIGSTILNLNKNIANVQNQTKFFDLFSQESLNTALNTTGIQQKIDLLDQNFKSATSEEEYGQIITNLLVLNYPESVSQGSVAESIEFFPNSEDIRPEVLESVSSGYDPSKVQNYAYAITLWNNENLNTRMDFKEYLGTYDDSQKIISRVFKIKLEEKKDILEDYYLVLPKLENLQFEQGIVSSDAGDYVYVNVNGKQSISFSTTSNVDFTDVPAFISPGVNSLTVTDATISTEPLSKPKLTILVLALIVLGIIALFAYVVLQQWYKRKYEAHLFKNRNDIYNMIHYVNSARKRGSKDKEIENNLKKAKWSSEQITYVMKKYAGKRTGMLELPVDKALKALKLKENEEK